KAGILRIVAQEGDTLEIGALVARIEEGSAPDAGETNESEATEAKGTPKTEEKADTTSDGSDTYAKGTASPAAAKILREKGIDPASINGTGKDGRITKE